MIDLALMTVRRASAGRSPSRSRTVNGVKEWEFPLVLLDVSSSHDGLSVPQGPWGQLPKPASKQKVELGRFPASSLMSQTSHFPLSDR